jgi:hypothetical protein
MAGIARPIEPRIRTTYGGSRVTGEKNLLEVGQAFVTESIHSHEAHK